MKKIQRNALFGLMTIMSGVLIFFGCQKETVEPQAEPKVEAKTTTGGGSGGGTSCTVSCFWGTASANCPEGGATCYCDWGSPVTSCNGGSATVSGSFNHAGLQDFEQFVLQNKMDPVLIQVSHELEIGFSSGSWDQYMQAQQNYVGAISAQPQSDQEMIAMWMESQQ
ncbi:MAG: hypothetical protein HWE22_02815 [Flavobacteriales bacterium]|nr:hypothetical protein [Flavobacteriales bacterium]